MKRTDNAEQVGLHIFERANLGQAPYRGATDSEGSPWYKNQRLNRLARINGGRLFGESTMLQMLEDGSLLEHWTVPDEEIFGTTPEYLAQFEEQ